MDLGTRLVGVGSLNVCGLKLFCVLRTQLSAPVTATEPPTMTWCMLMTFYNSFVVNLQPIAKRKGLGKKKKRENSIFGTFCFCQ